MRKFLMFISLIITVNTVNAQRKTRDSGITVKVQGSRDQNDFPVIDDPIEIYPHFRGGLKKFYEYLKSNIHYPPEAIKDNIQGKVSVLFTVEKDGRLTHLKVVKGVCKELDAEALRVVGNSPKWLPGTRNGKPYPFALSIPINFSLNKK